MKAIPFLCKKFNINIGDIEFGQANMHTNYVNFIRPNFSRYNKSLESLKEWCLNNQQLLCPRSLSVWISMTFYKIPQKGWKRHWAILKSWQLLPTCSKLVLVFITKIIHRILNICWAITGATVAEATQNVAKKVVIQLQSITNSLSNYYSLIQSL